jgi:hypothetical protein
MNNGTWLPRDEESWSKPPHYCKTPRKYFAKSNRWKCLECQQVWALGVNADYDGYTVEYRRKWVELELVEADLVPSHWWPL